MMILETERLVLRQLDENDFSDLCEILQDPEVMYAYEGPFSDEEVQVWLDRQLQRYATDGFGLWAVLLKETGEFIGQCGLTYQDFNGRQVVEVGYLFKKSFWHRGFATEAARACRDLAFRKYQAEEVYSIIRDTNLPSKAVALRNGMNPVGEVVKFYRQVVMPHVVYQVKMSEVVE